jgi:lipoprotein-anchoring transpeptidase ErfK/SrfK
MSLISRTIGALALLALIGSAIAWAVLSGGDSDEPTAASSPLRPAAPQPAQPARKPRLELSDRGQPIVWLRRGARIPIRSAPGGKVVKTLRWRTPFDSRTVLSVFRHVGRWAGAPTPLLPTGQLGWVKLDPSKLRAGWTPYTIDIDLSNRAAQLRRGDRVLRSFTVTVGAPGTSTPTGHFAVTDIFRGNLNPAYGCCAIATTARQLHLPSGWFGGDRIAIHGTTGPLGIAASHGCVRAANEDVNALVNRVRLGSPVVIRQ